MGPVFYVLAIMGCGDGQTQCEPARVEAQRFSTAAQCQAALPSVLARHTDIDYPVVTGACRASGLQMAAEKRSGSRG
ncbi:hypothetical protein [Sphingomonas sp.]|uniref:hypothetical protein n=1 Tax=Sphingomonas sp. TaxID=28214 RepID=UPI0035C81BF5